MNLHKTAIEISEYWTNIQISKNTEKHLHLSEGFGIIIERDCTRYAMKREVAVGMTGNFRRVCPI